MKKEQKQKRRDRITVDQLPPQVKAEMRKLIQLDPEWQKLANQKAASIRVMDYAHAVLLSKKMERLENQLINTFLIHYDCETVRLNELLDDIPKDDVFFLNTYTNAIVMIADMLETITEETNDILHKYHPDCTIEMFDKLVELTKESKHQLRFMWQNTSEDYQTEFGPITDDLTELVLNKAKKLTRKVEQ